MRYLFVSQTTSLRSEQQAKFHHVSCIHQMFLFEVANSPDVRQQVSKLRGKDDWDVFQGSSPSRAGNHMIVVANGVTYLHLSEQESDNIFVTLS